MTEKKEKVEKIDGKSKAVWEEKLQRLKQEFPEILSENQVDCDQLRKIVGDENVAEGERYQFTWAGKSNVFREIERRTSKTLLPDREESVNFDETDNIFIEGENLEVLKVLQKSYYGKVKMIYIDPPYNTGNDFIYNDNYRRTREEEEAAAGNIDEEGKLKSGLVKNTKTGRYHSNWLNMMYPRLFLARNLLRDDGVIFVSIDDNEVHNLRMIMNEIFGEENFVANIIWQKKYAPQNDARWLSDSHDHIVLYAKTKDKWSPIPLPRSDEQRARYKNPDNDPRGDWKADNLLRKDEQTTGLYEIVTPSGRVCTPPSGTSWRVPKSRFEKLVEDNRIWFGDDGDNIPALKRFISEVKQGVTPTTVWTYEEVGHNQQATREVRRIFDNKAFFDTPKPTRLIKQILHIGTESDDLVIDFFAGSGTTAHAVMDLNAEDGGNRKYIMVQLPEEMDEDSEARKAGYETIADIAKERIRRAGKKIMENRADDKNFDEDSLDTGFKVLKLYDSNFKQWRNEEIKSDEELQQKLEDVLENVKESAREEGMLIELTLKLGIDLNADIVQKDKFYLVDNSKYAICLADTIGEDLVEDILSEEPEIVVLLDTAFNGNDELKTNTALQMKDEDIEFRVI